MLNQKGILTTKTGEEEEEHMEAVIAKLHERQDPL